MQLRLSLLVIALLVVLVSLIGVLSSDSIREILTYQIGRKTLVLARAVAFNPTIRVGLETRNPEVVQAMTEEIRRTTGAAYVVVGDRQGTRYSHPHSERIGLGFVGGDLERVIEYGEYGESYVSSVVGTLGPSMRDFSPVRNDLGEVLGLVAAGYLNNEIEAEVHAQQRKVLGYVVVVLLLGAFGAAWIAKTFKAAIFGLEPHEIATLFEERNAIIEAIREGVVAVDGRGRLTLVNQAARRYLGRDSQEDLRSCQLTEICPCREMGEALAVRERVLDWEISVADRPMIVNVLPLKGGEAVTGAVASFRPKDELDQLSRKLLHMQEYSELLRAQTHEYSNKLHTIAGLIQIGAHREALDLIMAETSGYQDLMQTLAEAVPDPVLAGIILGKFNRARELKINLLLERDSSFADLPPQLERSHLVTVIGNLLDNSFEAVRELGENGEVRLFLTDLGLDLIIEVEDTGPGIAPEVAESLFEKGMTTHGGTGRGMGLYLVRG